MRNSGTTIAAMGAMRVEMIQKARCFFPRIWVRARP
jgi:hypothetical protein